MKNGLQKYAYLLLTVCLCGAIFYVLFKYLFPIAAPFVFSTLVAIFLSPVIEWASRVTKLSCRICGLLVVVLFFILCGACMFLISELLISGIAGLLSSLPQMIEIFLSEVANAVAHNEWLGGFSEFLNAEHLGSIFTGAFGDLVTEIPGAFMTLPSIVLFCATFTISCFYVSVDMDIIDRVVLSFFPTVKPKDIRRRVRSVVFGYGRAYATILFVTFAEVFLGLAIMRVQNSLFLAFLIAIVDILPILGVGTILIPWAVFCFLTSHAGLGVGLLVLYGITVVIRQVLEGKILGQHIGAHPLLTLISIYICVKLFGVRGVIVGMLVAFLLTEFIRSRQKGKTIYNLPVDKREL